MVHHRKASIQLKAVSPEKSHPLFILLVEDEPTHIAVMRHTIQSGSPNIKLKIVGSLQEYRNILTKSLPDIALIDLHLPDGKAFEVLTSPPEAGPFPIVVMTSSGDEKIAAKAIKAGALDYIVKSTETFKSMPQAIERALHEWKLIKERRQVEDELRESELRFRTLYENIAIGLYRTTPAGKILMANRALVKMLGYSSFEDLAERNLAKVGFTQTSQRKAFLRKIEMDDEVNDFESAWVRQDGSLIIIRESARAIRNAQGKTQYYDGTAEDITERRLAEVASRHAENALRESEDKFKYMFDYSPVGKSITLITGEISVNKAFCEMLGYTQEELQQKKWQDITHPDDIEMTQREIDMLLSGKKESSRFNKRFLHKNGVIVWIDLSSFLRKDENGKPLYFISTLVDITERKRAEEAVHASHDRLHLALESANSGVWEWDLITNENIWSDELWKLYGIEPNSCSPSYEVWQKTIHPDDREKTEKKVQEAARSGSPLNVEWRVIDHDGRVRWLVSRGRPLLNAKGKPVRFIGIVTDITDRKQAEELRFETLARFSGFAEASQYGMGMADLGGTILFANSTLAHMLGDKSADDCLGKHFPTAYYPPSMVKRFEQEVMPALMLEGHWHGELEILTVDGRRIPTDENYFIIQDAQGRPCYIADILTDITERRRAEEALQKSEERLSSFMNSASDTFYLLDANLNFVEINIKGLELIGKSREEVIGKNIVEIVPDVKTSGRFEKHLEVIRTGTPYIVEDFIPHPKFGNLHFILKSFKAGDYLGVIATDITHRKRSEELILRALDEWQETFDATNDAMWILDKDQRVLRANKTSELIFHRTNEELIGQHSWEIVHGTAQPIPDCPVLRAKNSLHRESMEMQIGKSWLEIIVDPILDEHGRYDGAVHIVSDITLRKQAEEALNSSEEKYRLLFKNNPAPMWVYDVESLAFLMVNDFAIDHYGYSREEFLKMTIEDIRPPEEIQRLRKVLTTHFGPLRKGGVMRHRKKDGSLIDVEITAHEIEYEDRRAMFILALDITERKRAEEALRLRESYLSAIIENQRGLLWLKDLDGRFLAVNNKFAGACGLNDPESLVGKTDLDIWPRELAEKYKADDDNVIQSKKQYTVEELISDRGDIHWFETFKNPIIDKQGKVIGTTGYSYDITERKRMGIALQESELRFRSLYENATIGLYRTTPDGKILLANPALVKMLGYASFQDLIKRNLEQEGFEYSDRRKEFLEKIEREGEIKSCEAKWIRQDSKAIFVLESARAIRDSQGKTLYYDGTVEDITNRKLLEEHLRHMQKMEGLGTLAGGIAHDFNNILGIILAYTTSIKRFKEDHKKLESAVETISKAVDRGKTLVQQILTFARKTETTFGAVNVNDVVVEIMAMIFETFPKTLTYSQNIDKAVGYINADRSQLHQALLNLCVNARDAMPGGGVLSINTHMVSAVNVQPQHPEASASSYVCIEVCDTGEGMAEETQKRIFEPFFTTKDIGKGTGLGLAVVFGVVQTHKGFIDVESDLGKGTTFRLYLPASQAAVPVNEKEEEKTLEEISGGTETLLVVEDEEMLLTSLRMILVEKGYTVLSAGDGLSALKLYQENKNGIALVLTDLGLPNMTGLEICQRIQTIKPKERMILVTGFLDPDMKSEFLKAGIEHFIYKPYDMKKVLRMVREVLDGE